MVTIVPENPALHYLKLAHGLYNVTVMALFFYQGRLGLLIRQARLSSSPIPFAAVKQHRKAGPPLLLAALLGFIAGATLVIIDKGTIFEYPLHLLVGFTIILCLLTTYAVSRRIKGPSSPFRTPHAIIGILVLCLYLVQALLGLSILL